ncbi:class I SAM-dependent methyltransferase [Microlunatus soli]|uniref:Ubiquinone/menaquinone biosynthesis C-methylase UbiE n=1 Tax=Microlunatus soli TaxID=630515 RepID=A0A1H1RXB9_9ACTN|nr:class I SAM-dependent methyltransferase [Microlunatus soli]SDS39629.1 Ubiquinone/menaquinone biosynthesis C-methylase UbiE [Microlunatus soli]
MDVHRTARYDGIAAWYDEQLAAAPHRPHLLRTQLGDGTGLCLDVGCGTGRDLQLIAATGRTPVGVELSSDQLRLATERCDRVIRGDAEQLPFAANTFPTVISCWTSTDVEDFAGMLTEIARVLRPGGRFLFYGVHPCFNGPHVESCADRSRLIHPSYRQARRHLTSPWWGVDGIRTKVGGMRHLPLADFINAFTDAGLRIGRVVEPDEEPVPYAIVVDADKPS